jgi:proteic killer suppression protein
MHRLKFVSNLVTLHPVIRSYRHKALKPLFETGRTAGIDPSHCKRLLVRLDALNHATKIEDLDQPGWRLHELKGERAGTWSLRVTGNYRLTFRFEGSDCFDVDYEDYH